MRGMPTYHPQTTKNRLVCISHVDKLLSDVKGRSSLLWVKNCRDCFVYMIVDQRWRRLIRSCVLFGYKADYGWVVMFAREVFPSWNDVAVPLHKATRLKMWPCHFSKTRDMCPLVLRIKGITILQMWKYIWLIWSLL